MGLVANLIFNRLKAEPEDEYHDISLDNARLKLSY